MCFALLHGSFRQHPALITILIRRRMPTRYHQRAQTIGGNQMRASNCETCMNYEYDEESRILCLYKNLDEDRCIISVKGEFSHCPYYQYGDEYQIVRKQM